MAYSLFLVLDFKYLGLKYNLMVYFYNQIGGNVCLYDKQS